MFPLDRKKSENQTNHHHSSPYSSIPQACGVIFQTNNNKTQKLTQRSRKPHSVSFLQEALFLQTLLGLQHPRLMMQRQPRARLLGHPLPEHL